VLDLPVIDTGLFYRGLTVAVLRGGIDPVDEAAVAAVARITAMEINTDSRRLASDWALRIDGHDVTADARDPQTAPLLSLVSRHPQVRAVLIERQRVLGAAGGVAMGRDCGTVIFPKARLKLFLDAAGEVRTRRRAAQLRASGREIDSGTLAQEIGGRDRIDSTRSASPLRAAADAQHIDTSDRSVEDTLTEALRMCREAGLIPG